MGGRGGEQMDLRASWPSSLIKMATPRLRKVVSKTRIEDNRGNHSKSKPFLPLFIYTRETQRAEGKKGKG